MYKALSLNRIEPKLLLRLCVWDRRLHSLMSSDYKQDVLAAILDANAKMEMGLLRFQIKKFYGSDTS